MEKSKRKKTRKTFNKKENNIGFKRDEESDKGIKRQREVKIRC